MAVAETVSKQSDSGSAVPTDVRRDGGAIPSFVLGLLGLWFGIFSPFAVLVGIWSLRRIRASGGGRTGIELSAGGFVAGVIGLVVALAGIAYWLLE